MAKLIQVRRGLDSQVPNLAEGEIGYATDTKDVYIGSGAGNTKLAKNSDTASKADKAYVDTELASKADKTYVDTELAKKADKTYVDTETAKLALNTDATRTTADKTVTGAINELKTSADTVSAQLADKTQVLVAGGTANDITLPVTLADKSKYSFKATVNSTGAVTINGVALKKTDGTAVSNIKANKVYDFYYDATASSVFILAKAEGDALVGDVLAGKTFSNGDDTGLLGTLALTGNATAADVRSGKTFYNTDAKTLLAGLAAIKEVASGTVKSPSTALQFIDVSGAGYQSSYITVSGLSFKPTTIIIYNIANILYPSFAAVVSTESGLKWNGYDIIGHYDLRLYGNAYIGSNSFQLPVNGYDVNFKWFAFR